MTPPRDRDGMTDDLLETRLRRALNTEASMVNPSGDGLGRIRAGIAEEQSSIWWRRPALALVAAAFLGLAVGGVAVALSQNDDKTNLPAGQTTEPQTSAPTADDHGSRADDLAVEHDEPASASTVNVPVYFVADDGRELRLYREFHRTAMQPEGKIATAVDQMFGPAIDPDYSSSWPETTKVLSVSKSGDTATVNLSAFPSTGADAETKAVQQLVYTVTATDNIREEGAPAGQRQGTAVRSLRLVAAGGPRLDARRAGADLDPDPDRGSHGRLTGQGDGLRHRLRGQRHAAGLPGRRRRSPSTFVTTGDGRRSARPARPSRSTRAAMSCAPSTSSAQDGSPLQRDSKTFTVK